jgi:uncharacterized RDD family membrane protein YckC
MTNQNDLLDTGIDIKEIKKSQAFIWQRFIGLVIDFIVVYFISIPAILLTDDKKYFYYPFSILLGLIFYFLLLEFKYGKTIGKVITMTKVIYVPTGKVPDFTTCLGRSISRMIPLDWASYFFSFKPAGWHDRISNTRVIRDKNYYPILTKKYLHRLFEINKGMFRILIITFSILSIFSGFITSSESNWGLEEVIFFGVIYTLMYFFAFWLILWLIMILINWVKKGFEDAK